MFFQLAHLLRSQFNAPFWRSNIIAYYVARAAFIFKKGTNRTEYEKALPYLVKYYQQVQRLSKEEFNIEAAVATELEWWIVHRDKKRYNYNDLQLALQKNTAAIFSASDTLFNEYAFYRTRAMKLRDEKEAVGEVEEKDWQSIESDLRNSWSELYKAVNN